VRYFRKGSQTTALQLLRTLSPQNKLTLCKLSIRSVLTYAAPVWSNKPSTNYRRLQTLQSKCLRIISNSPRRTPIPLLHATFNITPIRNQIHNMTARFFYTSTNHKNPLVRAIGNYTLTDLRQQYKKYIHKQNTFYSKPRPSTTHSSVFSLSIIFTAITVVSPYSSYHHLMTRGQTTVINWCKEQLYVPLYIFV
jgi:hypothetical protein